MENKMSEHFVYKASIWRTLSSATSVIIFFALATYMLVTTLSLTSYDKSIFIIVPLFLYFGGLLFYIFLRYSACLSKTITISPDTDIFYFNDGLEEKKFNKKDIEKIVIYQPGGTRKLHYFYAFEIHFKDGVVLKFSNISMPLKDFMNDFPNDLFSYGRESPFWKL